jgi:DNA-binding beta-propeller fold protein YncE
MPPKKKATKKPAKKAKASRRSRKSSGRAGLVALAVIAVLALGVVGGVLALRPAKVVAIPCDIQQAIGSQGAAPGQMDNPRGVAVAPDGSVYMADLGNSRILHFAADGKALDIIGKKGDKPGQFNEPSGVAVDSQGRVLVADTWNGRIQVFNAKGQVEGELKNFSFYSPRNVAVDKSDNIYVADTGNSKIKVFSRDLQLIKEIGELGGGKGRFREVFGIAINSKGEIFAADPGNRKVHKFSPLPDAKPVAEVKVAGWQRGGPFWPHLAVDSSDRVYAVDNANHQVWVYDSSLNYLGTLGAVPGHELFANPIGIAAAGPALWVSDAGKDQLLKVGGMLFPTAR